MKTFMIIYSDIQQQHLYQNLDEVNKCSKCFIDEHSYKHLSNSYEYLQVHIVQDFRVIF